MFFGGLQPLGSLSSVTYVFLTLTVRGQIAIRAPKPYEFIGKLVIHGPKPYELIQLTLGHKEQSLRSPGAGHQNHRKTAKTILNHRRS